MLVVGDEPDHRVSSSSVCVRYDSAGREDQTKVISYAYISIGDYY